ncbi:ComF family protein [Rosistilla carotiformis]|nr:ComF family protein [Rosistilla carotiformis]
MAAKTSPQSAVRSGLRDGNAWSRLPLSVANAFLEMVYPPTCTLCGGALLPTRSVQMCDACIDAVRGSCRHWCRRCGMPMEPMRLEERKCNRCGKQKLPFEEVVVLGRYEGAMREAVIAGKKYIHEPLVMALGELLGQQIASRLDPIPEIVTFVPSHWRRRLGRGTVPAATLAKQVGRVLGRPVHTATRCTRGTTKQGKLAADQRARNISNAFAVRRRYHPKGRTYLLIDDVMTTGATLSEVARVLLAAGATRVCVAATARGVGKN